ncbi:MAG: hypothetical protein NT169_02585 [Chloroflexi bacterium]|nr:hypothetical protein [Chloroflexota bacterium]
MWHKLSGLPDNVTDEGVVVAAAEGQRLQAEKQLLRGTIANLRTAAVPVDVSDLARLAASYLLCGDVETAQRYVAMAQAQLDPTSKGFVKE